MFTRSVEAQTHDRPTMSVEMQTDEMGEVIPVAPVPGILKADESAMTASSETQTDKSEGRCARGYCAWCSRYRWRNGCV